MNILDSVLIEGLWRPSTPPISFKLDQNFNFLIGQNGTGKTTVINLIAAALEADFERLDKIQFTRLLITLKDQKSRKKPSIEVTKKEKKEVPYYDIQYRIKSSVKDEAKTFDLDALAEEQFYRGMPPRMLRDRHYREKFLDIKHQLQTMVSVCWLSVHRQNEEQRATDDRKYIPAVDQKLATLNTSFLKYFSQLSRNYAEQTKEFQKKSFLSLLSVEAVHTIAGFSKTIDIDKEKETLSNVLEILGVDRDKYTAQLKSHFEKFDTARTDFLNENKLTTTSFAPIYNALKAHSLVQYYEELELRKKEIFRPQDNFLLVINELFDGRKTIHVTERNEVTVKTKDGRQIALEELSSGEKQLLIILGEALLREESTVVYIADEPELSLHVKWQEKLTDAIAKLNPNTQIIFATHSPDIVSRHTSNMIDMESLLG